MSKSDDLLSAFADSTKFGGGIHTVQEMAFMIQDNVTPKFRKFVLHCEKRGLLRRVAIGIYESQLTPANPSTALYQIAMKLRGDVLTYISLESQLSYTGEISQILFDRLTVVTKGRKGEFKTPYGVIEFTHSKRPVDALAKDLYFDYEVKMFRATSALARRDLKLSGRNTNMLE